ncbi:MAG TPA: Calx-beta domain-containing protein, partial [Pyrinomonadaceae bacterium]|nr:Calx-beta domain-containing protein [Pyrinomonadaceae bacterium]
MREKTRQASVVGVNRSILTSFHANVFSLGISGRVTGVGGNALSGVTLTLSGDQAGTTTSDQNGDYTFANLPILGDFTITPTFPNFSFAPAHSTFNDLNTSVINADFTGTAIVEGLSINDVFVSEPISGTSTAHFTVTLSSPSLQMVTVDYSTADGIATAPLDYLSIPTTQLTFTPGQISKTIDVTLNSDLVAETLETFFVNLSNANGATIGRWQGVGRIRQPVLNGNISFYDNRPDGIHLMNSDGTDQIFLTTGYPPLWSPQGSKILFSDYSDSGFGEFYSINSNGSGRTRLTNDLAFEFDPAWSSDETKLVFYSRRDGNDEIYTMNANGSNQTRL